MVCRLGQPVPGPPFRPAAAAHRGPRQRLEREGACSYSSVKRHSSFTILAVQFWLHHCSEDVFNYIVLVSKVFWTEAHSPCLFRWWALREKALGSVFNATANVNMHVNHLVAGPEHRESRHKIFRWSHAGTHLIVAERARERSQGLFRCSSSTIMAVPSLAEPILAVLNQVSLCQFRLYHFWL